MDPQFSIQETKKNWASLSIQLKDYNLMSGVSYQLHYEAEEYFPKSVSFSTQKISKISTEQGELKWEEGKLEVGMVGSLQLETIVPNPVEYFIFKILEVNEETQVLAEIIRPQNIPICKDRWSIICNFPRERSKPSENVSWSTLTTVVGLDISCDFQIDENTWMLN